MRLPAHPLIMQFALPAQNTAKQLVKHPDSTFVVSDLAEKKTAQGKVQSLYVHDFIDHHITPSVHSATAAVLSDGRLISCWYGGTREGHRDVRIFCAYYQQQQWSEPHVVMTRQQTAQATRTYIKKLGNPVLYFSAQKQQLWLFYVSVSVGGWSASQINFAVSADMGLTWSQPRRLISSPFINISTLVKNTPVEMDQGYLALPVYHEGLAKFSELLLLDIEQQQVIYKSRISHRRSGIQPYLFVADTQHAMAVIRNTMAKSASGVSEKKMLFSTTENGGLHWQPMRVTGLLNPDSAVGGLAVDGLPWLVAFNDHRDTRENLSLAAYIGDKWQHIATLMEEEGGRFSYPWLLRDHDGIFHVFFTHHRQQIDHIRFNKAWLLEKIEKQMDALFAQGVASTRGHR